VELCLHSLMCLYGCTGTALPYLTLRYLTLPYVTLPRAQESLEWIYIHPVTQERTLTALRGAKPPACNRKHPCRKSRPQRCCVACDPTVEASPGRQAAKHVVFLAVTAWNSHISVEDALGVGRELSAREGHGWSALRESV